MKTLSSKQVKNLEGQTISFGKAYIKSCQLHNVNVLPHLISADPCHLDLDVTKFASDQDWTPVIASLKKNRDLQKIVINANARARMDGKNNLKLLPDLMASVRDVLMFNIKLTSLEITNIALKDGTLQILAKGLLNNTSLNYLSLSKSSIGDSGLATLSPGLRTLNNLQVLNLTSCCLTEKGASTISSFLKSLAVRQQTDVWKNSLRHSPLDMDCKSISQRHPKSLKRLIICNNNLRDAGVTILFDLLIEQPGLIGLDLQFNSLTEVIGQKSILLLKANRELCILDLRNNLIDAQTLSKLGHYLSINDKLRLVKNPMPDPDLELVDETVGKLMTRSKLPIGSVTGKLRAKSKDSNSKSRIDTGLGELKNRVRAASAKLKPKAFRSKSIAEINHKASIKRVSLYQKLVNSPPKSIDKRATTSPRKFKVSTNPKTIIAAPRMSHGHRHDPKEIEMVLQALDRYHDSTGKVGISQLTNPSADITSTANNPTIQSGYGYSSKPISNSADSDAIRSMEDKEDLVKRVDVLERLVRNLMQNFPTHRNQIANNVRASDVDHVDGTKSDGYPQISTHNCSKIINRDIHQDIVELKGTLKQKTPSDLEQMITSLETSLVGFDRVLDKLEASVVKVL